MKTSNQVKAVTLVVGLLAAGNVLAAEVEFADPKGDDNGPGGYIYPTDSVYEPGSFDLTGFEVKSSGSKVTFSTEVATKLKDPWSMGGGFSVQMMMIFIDTDNQEGSGHTQGLPGLNVTFDPAHAWDKVVILSPQKPARVNSEIRAKSADIGDDILVPGRTRARGNKIVADVKLADLGGGDPATWRYQVIVQSNEGFPAKSDLLTRKVNEYEGQHRFGGGHDSDCDPHVMDVLAGDAAGDSSEVALQHEMLSYECDDEGNAVKGAVLSMVGK